MFIFNTDILLIDIGWVGGLKAVLATSVGMLAFCSATQRYMLARNRPWESVILLLVAFTMFRPDYWLDRVSPPFLELPGPQVVQHLETQPTDGSLAMLRARLSGPDFDDADRIVDRSVILELAAEGGPLDRLEGAGLLVNIDEGVAAVDEPFPGTPLFQELKGFDFYADRPVTLDVVLI